MSAVWNQWQQTATDAQAEPEDGTAQATQAAIDLANELGVDLNTVTGTGLNGKITVPDVEAAAGD